MCALMKEHCLYTVQRSHAEIEAIVRDSEMKAAVFDEKFSELNTNGHMIKTLLTLSK